ncbi:ATP-binding cassette domain-containing protein [Actinopolymorpha pittospori]|uniref:ABC-2 type transport system ATP-binding protein n=1 Tax=Actinopolymorpha pittospori TaxID=648752 RepID=A0A927RCV6_9ACTN|nr:ATP-binding cassette domain-containing protein [Actinopolymorpha pittospori]MBE1610324.1 ABC-2 type transport system ATP-binding protein [Actinopolymorpha pittospori]
MPAHLPAHPPPALVPDRGPATGAGAYAIEAKDLAKTYGRGDKAVRALSGVSFDVPAGAVFGLLGPNGAGKSTTVKILTTLSRADAGTASVAGIDVDRQPALVRRAIGFVSQRAGFDPMGTGRENLILTGRIYGLSGTAARQRADELLARFGLAEAANRLVGKWSGGMQRKLDVAMGLIHRPRVLFLDEPTTGLDPEARADMWTEISRLTQDDGLTVLLTTHYLEEADRLADQLVIIDRGAIVAAGTPGELKSQLDGDTVQVELTDSDVDGRARSLLASIPGVREVSVEATTLRARVSNGAAALPALLSALDDAGVGLAAVTVARPSLDDVYLRYAGRSFQRADTDSQRPDQAKEVAR